MQIEERLQQLKKIENIAALAGVKGRIDDDARHFGMSFSTAEGRSQMVYVRPTGKTPDGEHIVTMFSPVLKLKQGIFAGLSKDQAVELLKLNESTFFARFGLWQSDNEVIVVASSDLLLDTLDPAELRAHAFFVATAADKYEAKHGLDNY